MKELFNNVTHGALTTTSYMKAISVLLWGSNDLYYLIKLYINDTLFGGYFMLVGFDYAHFANVNTDVIFNVCVSAL